MNKSVDVFIASLPERSFLNNTIISLLKQNEVNNIYCILNNYSRADKMELLKYKQVFYFDRNNLKGCSERFFNIEISKSKYIAFADDDFEVGENYFKQLIEAAEKYKALVSYHGCIMKNLVRNYYRDRKVYHCCATIDEDIKVNIIGCGASLAKRVLLPLLPYYYKQIEHPNMDDIYYSYMAAQCGLNRYVIAHKKGIIIPKPYEKNDNYIYDKLKNKCQPQTDFVNKYFLCK